MRKYSLAKQSRLKTDKLNSFFSELETLCQNFDEESLNAWIDKLVPAASPDATQPNNIIHIKQN